jgi:transposase-like protein
VERARHPVGGVDYPRTFEEFDAWFSTEEGCARYLERLRWPRGFCCPRCGGTTVWRTARRLMHCGGCGRQTSLIAGTVFEGTRKPLRTWFQAMWYVTSQKSGMSALGLKRVLGLGSYRTAWTWMHKLRRAMVRPGRDLLSGRVEVDESYVGEDEGADGRHTVKKALVVIAIEVHDPKGFGRVRLRQIADASRPSLIPFVQDVVAPGSTVVTDGWPGYGGLEELGYSHERRILWGSGQAAHVLLPGPHRIASLLKRWLLGTHQGAVSQEHLDYYLDEYTFRFNRRTSQAPGLLFHRLVEQAVRTDPVPFTRIAQGTGRGVRRGEDRIEGA